MPYFYPIHDAPYDYQRWTRHGWSRSLGQVGLEVEVIETRGHSLHAAAITTCLGMAGPLQDRSEEHTSELQSLMRISYAVFCLKKNNTTLYNPNITYHHLRKDTSI